METVINSMVFKVSLMAEIDLLERILIRALLSQCEAPHHHLGHKLWCYSFKVLYLLVLLRCLRFRIINRCQSCITATAWCREGVLNYASLPAFNSQSVASLARPYFSYLSAVCTRGSGLLFDQLWFFNFLLIESELTKCFKKFCKFPIYFQSNYN